LKLVCIPPIIGQNGDFSHGQIPDTVQQSTPINPLAPTCLDIVNHQISPQQCSEGTPLHTVSGSREYNHDARLYPAQSYLTHPEDQRRLYHEVPPPHLAIIQQSFHQPPTVFPAPPIQPPVSNVDEVTFAKLEQSAAENLSEALGELKIDETGIGMASTNAAFFSSPSPYFISAFSFSPWRHCPSVGCQLMSTFSAVYQAAAEWSEWAGSASARRV
jgi:hypothetical protein